MRSHSRAMGVRGRAEGWSSGNGTSHFLRQRGTTVTVELHRGDVVWADVNPTLGRGQAGRRPVLVVASDLFLAKADTLAIVLPCTTADRGWPNHVRLTGPHLELPRPTFVLTEQPRMITRDRLGSLLGRVDVTTMREVDVWLRDFLALP